MKCPLCKKKDPKHREMCPFCGAPILPIPIPPNGKIRFGGYNRFVFDSCDDKVLIITEKLIDKRPYHRKSCKITWESCDIRKCLNGAYYNSFAAVDRERIIETIINNKDNLWYGTSGGNDTVDKIFLPSIEEMIRYFGDSGKIKTRYMYPMPIGNWCKDEFLP